MKFIKKFFVFIIAIIFIFFLYVYRQYNLNINKVPNSTEKQEVVCVDEYKPVCGEDKRSYSNSCVAEKINKVVVAYEGECKEEVVDTGGTNITGSGTGETTDLTGETVKLEEKPTENTPEIKVESEYYKNLKSQCNSNECCLASVDIMENGDFKEAVYGVCQGGFSISMLKCEESYKWCEPDVVPNPNSGTAGSSTGTIDGQKVQSYSNPNFNYGFSLPSSMYYSGYGAQNGANHTVGVSYSSGTVDFSEADIKIFFYKSKILPEIEGDTYGFYKDKTNGRIYFELSGNTVIVEGKPGTEKIVDMIIKSMYAK